MIETQNIEHVLSTQFVRLIVGKALVLRPGSKSIFWNKQKRRAARRLADAGLSDAAVVAGLRAFAERCRIEAVAQRDAARLVALADADAAEERQ